MNLLIQSHQPFVGQEDNRIQVEIIQVQSRYFLNLNQGLELLGKTPAWFEALQSVPSRWKKLKKKGFSGQLLRIAPSPNQQSVELITVRDWLALVAYLASHSNPGQTHLIDGLIAGSDF